MSMINNGLSALLAAQRGLQVTANNVANASTEGYARQRVNLTESVSTVLGQGMTVGTGVRIAGIERIYDQFLADSLRSATTAEQRAQVYSDLAGRLDSLLGNPEIGLNSSLDAFFAQAELLSRDPTSPLYRQQLLLQADSLAQTFRQMDSRLAALADEVDRRLAQAVNQVNSLADALARVNDQIASQSLNPPNDLLDQQELLLRQLSGLIDTTAVREDNGTVTVLVGNGQPLVVGPRAAALALVADLFDPSRMQLAFVSAGQTQDISRRVSGGTIGGLIGFRSEALDAARRELGLIAIGLAETMNAQHHLGVDFRGELGGDFFASIDAGAFASTANTGSATVGAVIEDFGALGSQNYELRFNGSAWQLRDTTTGATIAMTGAGTAGDPFRAGGLAIVVSGAAAAGDRFLISPANGAASRLSVALTDPLAIAAASPLSTSRSLQNGSDALISAASVTDIGNAALLQPVRIVFDDVTTFRIVDTGGADLSGPLAYTSGAAISFNGWSVTVNGTPAAGDSFSIGPTGAGSGDNGNALALARAGAKGVFSGGQVSVEDVAGRLVASVGATALRAAQDLAVQGALREQLAFDLDSIAGVNLEEEAANMLRYQEAFQAASKIVGVANELFQTLLNALR
jgi:flagellar hook-associated protein 1 FlgK